MRSSYEAMHDETRDLRLLDGEPQKPPPATVAMALVIIPIVVLFLL